MKCTIIRGWYNGMRDQLIKYKGLLLLLCLALFIRESLFPQEVKATSSPRFHSIGGGVLPDQGKFAFGTNLAKDKRYYRTSVEWGLGLNKRHKTPDGSVPYHGFSLKKYGAYYHGSTKEKTIYLTFDCGYENGHTRKILKILKKNQIKAIFFITKDYLMENPKLVKKMKKQGHLVGNHTCSHPLLAKCSKKKIRAEVQGLEQVMLQKTGYAMDKFIRPPEGNYSIKALKTLQEMGYTTILWSLAWVDYFEDAQPSVKTVLSKFKIYHHKGMIPLLHVISSADTKALPKIIAYMRAKGYRFGTVDHI